MTQVLIQHKPIANQHMKKVFAILLALTLPLSAQHRFGWKPSPHGIRATEIKYHPGFRAQPLPATASVAQWFYPTNQGDRGACVAFSAWESYSAAHSRDFGKPVALSPLDIYQQCLVRDGSFPQDNGTYGSSAIAVLLNPGAMVEKTWPYSNPLEVLPRMTSYMKGQRTKHRASSAYAVPVGDNGFAIKQCIANLKIAVMIGSYWYGNGMSTQHVQCSTKDSTGATKVVTRDILPNPSGRPVGGHEIPVIEYDDNLTFPNGDVGGVRIHNHWQENNGKPWGDSIGSCWISYKWAFNTRYVDDAVAIEIVKK